MPYDVEEIEPTVFSPGRRVKLPCHRPNVDVSLWNILKKNIGKDLSKVAMPVTLNEPLNALQVRYNDKFLNFVSACLNFIKVAMVQFAHIYHRVEWGRINYVQRY